MKNITFLPIAFIMAIIFLNGKCSTKNTLNTNKYHKITARLQKNIAEIDSIYWILKEYPCRDLKRMDSILIKNDQICLILESYNLPTGELLTVEKCVVKDEVINMKTVMRLAYLKEKLEYLDSIIIAFDQEIEDYKNTLKKECLNTYNSCKQVKNSGKNQTIVNLIEQLIVLREKPDSLIQNTFDLKEKLRRYMVIATDEEGTSPFLRDLLIALINDIDYALTEPKNTFICNDAQIRWTNLEREYFYRTFACERNYLYDLSKENWLVTIDSSWVAQQAKKSRQCAYKHNPKGCNCPLSINFDSLAKIDNGTCVGCMDSLALNFSIHAQRQDNAPCKYPACNNSCYAEYLPDVRKIYPKFIFGRDSIIQVDSLCKNNLCGCTNPCAENFNVNAKISSTPDTCKGIICGCLDSTAVNYARRQSPGRIKGVVNNPLVTQHDSSLCHWRGCTSICALNYDSLARENDGSCICKMTSRSDLEKKIIALELGAVDKEFSSQKLNQEFQEYSDNISGGNYSVNFEQIGLDLIVNTEINEMRILSKGEQNGIPLGEYNFRPVNELIDALISFLNFKTRGLSGSMLTVRIIGEADATQIRDGGIIFRNAGRDIVNEKYKILSSGISTKIRDISQKDYDLVPDSNPINLTEGEFITDNQVLAFTRAYIVKQKIKDAEPSIEESRILVGAKANTVEGKKYRRIAIYMLLSGFYQVLGREAMQNSDQMKQLENAIDFYDREGYPTPGKKYEKCPCY